MKLLIESLFKISLLLVILFSFSSFKKNKKKKRPISYQSIYDKAKKSILSTQEYNYRLNSSYIPNWSCTTVPPFRNQAEIQKRYIDSVKKLNNRIKYLPCGCEHNPNISLMENYKKCDSFDTYQKIIETTNNIFRQKFYDSLRYTPPSNNSLESEMDIKIYENFNTRVEHEVNNIKW